MLIRGRTTTAHGFPTLRKQSQCRKIPKTENRKDAPSCPFLIGMNTAPQYAIQEFKKKSKHSNKNAIIILGLVFCPKQLLCGCGVKNRQER